MLSNYTIKQALPRLILAAIAINLSYWICAAFVDVSNLLGQSIFALLKQLHTDTILKAPDIVPFMTVMLAGNAAAAATLGTIGVGLTAAILIAGPTALVGPILLFFSAFLGVMLAIFIALLILAARQALIVILIFTAPIAFAFYVLPGTKPWFDRWRKLLTTMLVFYPLFALLYGGSLIAAGVLIGLSGNDSTNELLKVVLLLMGIIAQFAPLFLTPWLLKNSSGMLGKVAGQLQQRGQRIASMPGKLGKKALQKTAQETGLGMKAAFKRAAISSNPSSRRGRALRFLAFSGARREQRKERNEASISRSDNSYGLENDRMRELHEGTMTDKETAEGLKSQADAHALDHSAEAQQAVSYKKYQSTDASLRRSNIETRASTEHMNSNVPLYVDEAAAKGAQARVSAAKDTTLKELTSSSEGARVAQRLGVDPTIAQQMNQDALRTHVSQQRLNSANRVVTQEQAEAVEQDINLQATAGGIDTQYGAERAKAVATQTLHKAFDENVATEKTTFTGSTHDELLKSATDKPQSPERGAAAAGFIMGRNYREGHLQLLNAAGKMGQAATTPEEKEIVGSIQKQIIADMKQKSFAVSDTAMGQLQIGTYGMDQPIDPSTGRPGRKLGNINQELAERVGVKLSPEGLVGLNPDELKRIQKMARGTLQGAPTLSASQLANLKDAINKARVNDRTKDNIKPEAAALHEDILNI